MTYENQGNDGDMITSTESKYKESEKGTKRNQIRRKANRLMKKCRKREVKQL